MDAIMDNSMEASIDVPTINMSGMAAKPKIARVYGKEKKDMTEDEVEDIKKRIQEKKDKVKKLSAKESEFK